MTEQQTDTIRRLLIRLEDERKEVQDLCRRTEYPLNARFERVCDCIETAEKLLKESISR